MNNSRWVISLFEGEKTLLFWAGLIILSLASLLLFAMIWSLRQYSLASSSYLVNNFPQFLGAAVFILIGLYMMKSGIKKEKQLVPFAD
jgi:putative Mn2+ efflux pump MntP